MNNRLLAILIIFPIWLLLVILFRKQRQWLLYYLVAAFGLTIQLVFLAEYLAFDQVLVNIASYHVNLLGKAFFHVPIELLTNGRFQILTVQGSSILKLGIECSAVLESSVLISLILFYPLFNPTQKLLRITFGLILTYVINISRLLIIVLMAYKFGPEYIFVAHAGIARVFFFICELILYWYLMTKPTLKTVGESIEKHSSVYRMAEIGRALKLRHAIMQSIVIFVFIGLSITSFLVSDEWHKAFQDISKENRPLIYQEETSVTPVTDTQASLYKEINLDLSSNEKTQFEFNIQKAEMLNVRVLSGNQDLAARLLLNGQKVELVSLPKWLFNREKSIFKPVAVKPGDKLELKFQNLTDKSAQYSIKVYPDGMENVRLCALEILKNSPVVEPEPVSAAAEKIAKSVLGESSTATQMNRSITLNLLGGQKTSFKYEIENDDQLNLQVLEGQKALAAKLIINGVEVGSVSFGQWRFSKYDSIFEPFHVKAGDVVELRFQNISQTQSQYLLKLYSSKEDNV